MDMSYTIPSFREGEMHPFGGGFLHLLAHGDIISLRSMGAPAMLEEAGSTMGFLAKIKKIFSGGGPSPPLLDVVVRCNRCGEIIRSQINLHNDLSLRDDDTYYCRKGLVGGENTRCFQEVVIEYVFDAKRNVIDRRIQGGQFADEGE